MGLSWETVLQEIKEHIIIIFLSLFVLFIDFLGAFNTLLQLLFGSDVNFPPYIGVIFLIAVVAIFFVVKTILYETRPQDPDKKIKKDLRYLDIKFAIDKLEKTIITANILSGPNNNTDFYKKNIIVGIDRGGAIVGGLLGKKLHLPVTTIGIRWAKDSPVDPKLSRRRPPIQTGIDARENFSNIDFDTVEVILLVDDAVRNATAMSAAIYTLRTYIQKNKPDRCAHIRYYTASILDEGDWTGGGPRPSGFKLNFHVYSAEKNNLKLPWDTNLC